MNFTARLVPSGVLLSLLLLGGCASQLQATGLLRAPPDGLARAVELKQVPFFPQERYQCGPAALATVLNWSGVTVTPEQLRDEVYLPQRHGSLQVELTAAARHHRRLPYVLTQDLQAVLDEVRAGHPVLVLLNLGSVLVSGLALCGGGGFRPAARCGTHALRDAATRGDLPGIV